MPAPQKKRLCLLHVPVEVHLEYQGHLVQIASLSISDRLGGALRDRGITTG
jgi:hypothetical protein